MVWGMAKHLYQTKRDSRYGHKARNSSNPNLRYCGLDRAGFFSMQRDTRNLTNWEPMVCKMELVNGKRVCFLGDDSEKWIESK
jgi:hypothetical protein